MARLRKDKGENPKNVAPVSAQKQAKSKKSGKGGKDLKSQVLALGGDERDLELLKGVDGNEGAVQGAGKADKNLSKDVSKLLKELNLASGAGARPAKKVSDDSGKKGKNEKSKKDAASPSKPERDAKAKQPKRKQPAQASDPASSTQHQKAAQPQKQKAKDEKQKAKGEKQKAVAPKKTESTPLPISTILDAPPQSSSAVKLPPTPHWYTLVPVLAPSAAPATPTPSQLNALTSRASSLLAALAPATSTSSASDAAFLKSVLAGGTLSDRLSALTLLAQGSPLHNTRALDALRGMAERGKGGGGGEGAKAGGREERLKAVRAIVDWWVGGGAPERKLKYFRDQPLLHPDVTDEHLLLWYFEDWLKKYFFAILQVLEALSLDPLPYVRTQALSLIATLLREKPEQEHNLLRLLVNKLGDTEKSIAARASYHLLQLLQAHPRMKQIVIRETTALIRRPISSSSALQQASTSAPKPKMHIKFEDDAPSKAPARQEKPKLTPAQVHARYYAAITFNQIVLGPEEPDRVAARMLLDVYFSLFREVVGEREDAAPPPDAQDEPASEVEEDEGKGGRGKGKGRYEGREKQAMKKKEVRGAAGFAEVQDEHSRLVSAILTGVNRALPFARLGGGDVEFDRHMDTLFLITHTSTFNITLQALTLIQQIVSALPASPPSPITARYFRTLYGTLLDPRLFGTAKQALYLNLLFKSVKHDADLERVKAFVKRFCQILVGGFGGTEFVAGGLWLLGELFNTVPGLRDIVDEPPKEQVEAYDPRKRDPQYAHASSAGLWELTPLLHHYHPTIALLARQLLTRAPLTTSPDLALHTLTHFLDRFVYKNPKKPSTRGASAMQPAAAAGDGTSVRRVRGDVQEQPVNEQGWWKRSAASVPADQMFFHKYFSQKHERERAMAAKVGKRKGKGGEDESEEDDDEDADADMDEEDGEEDGEEDSAAEEEIWKAMKASMPELDGGADDDDDVSDDIPSGLDASDSEVEGEDGEEAEAASEDEDDEQEPDEGGEDDAFSLAEGSDADDLISLDADAPPGLIEYDGPDASADEDEEWAGFGGAKRKRGNDEKEKGGKKKKLRALPTFASYEDYAKMIEDAEEDNI